MTTVTAFKKFLLYKKICKSLSKELALFKTKELTPDLGIVADEAAEHTNYVLKRVLRVRNALRLLIGKPDPNFIMSLLDSGSKFADLSTQLGTSWHYADNQLQRKNKNKKFLEKEHHYSEIRDTLNSLVALEDFSSTVAKYFGAHQHIISGRNFTWLGYLITFISGIASAVLIGLVQDGIKRSSQPPVARNYYYIPQSIESHDSMLPSTGCGNSIATQRSDARRCASGHIISDPCFIDLIDPDFVTCPGDPRKASSSKSFKVTGEEFGGLDKELPEAKESYNPWFIITESGSACGYITGTSLVAANQRFNYGCSGGDESYLLNSTKKNDGRVTVGCVKRSDGNKIQECIAKEVWY